MKNRTHRNSDSGALRISRRVNLAMAVVEQVREQVAGGRPADAALQAIFRKHREYGSRDRKLYANMVFSCFRWLGWLKGLAPVQVCAMAQMLEAGETSELLTALAEAAGFQAVPMAPLSLEQKARETGQMLGRELSVEALLPAGVLEHIPVPEGRRISFIGSMQTRPPVWLRFADADTADRFSTGGAVIHPRLSEAAALPENFNRELLNTPEGRKAEVQDLSSQCVGLIAGPKRGERWWDVCAGAGGKALHLAALTEGQADILASDLRETSLNRLAGRAERTGMRGLRTAVMDGRKDTPGLGEFEGVIVDAPCSGIGTWARNPDARWRFAPDMISRSAGVQKQILRNAARHLRPGGVLVYAVCTCTREETETVTSDFLSEFSGFKPASFTHPLTGTLCPGACMIWPEAGPCNGMFIAKFQKLGDQG